ncbi:acyl-CoA dehydrogenase [Streptomyces sp. NPDC005336]|uniref:acyl-CoA dehydrogenase n=1 Tax=Streptomyces sp. NPDC005336 TaxID=3157035 RepID=UPI0033B7C1F5
MTTPYDADLVALLADASFDRHTPPPAAAAPYPEPAAWAYEGLRRITAAVGGGKPLLADHRRLRALLELTAITDPVLFHVTFLHHCMTVGPALDYGATAADIAELTSGSAMGAALMTELGQGNSDADIRTEATYDARTREFVLHTPGPEAAKYPPNVGLPGVPRLAVVSARLQAGGADRGTCLFLVPLQDARAPHPGVVIHRRPPTALLPLDYATVSFDRVRVPHHRWLADGATIDPNGVFRDPLADPPTRTGRSLSMSRFACGAVTAGLAAAARAGVSIALRHAGRRRTHDRLAGAVPALAHHNQRRLLFGALAQAFAATALARAATRDSWEIPDGGGRGHGPGPGAMRRFALAKTAADRLAEEAISRSRSAAGAAAFFSENRLVDYHALAMAFRSACGDNQLILLDAARSMAAGIDYAPPTEDAPDHWLRLFRARERLLHAELTAALRAAEALGIDAFTAWDTHTDLAQRFAEAHLARVTAEAAHAAYRPGEPPSGSATDIRAQLYQLFCLEEITAHSGWYHEAGLLTVEDTRALPDRLAHTCRTLMPRLDETQAVLDVPSALTRGPLAGPDYVADLYAQLEERPPPFPCPGRGHTV